MTQRFSDHRRRALPDGDPIDLSTVPGCDGRLPLVRPSTPGVSLTGWAAANRQRLDGWLDEHGAVLFRGFDLSSAERFQDLVSVAAGEPLEYRERSTPRTAVHDRVYTSTEYPASEHIPLHCENSYAHTWPLRLIFWSLTPAATGGQTPIADCRRVLARLGREVRARFAERGVRYVRNLGGGLGLDWRAVFQTDDRAQAEQACQAAGYAYRWHGDRLHLSRVGPAIVRHPRTGELTWFNHAVLFHVSSLPAAVADALLSEYGKDGLPNNTYYGDGSDLEPDVLAELRAAYEAEALAFTWERGDVLIVDNMLVAHGRVPYTGSRRLLVTMAQPFSADQLVKESVDV
ncbi:MULTISPECIES: TauD/TfdA family dioxygenase [unclassified Nonomuraea]|uniref:TauD/TfdA family dioxygenase n=1 Tax=unclassified Nonomuraea TaxID=2593643 RepID=UPI00340FA8EC